MKGSGWLVRDFKDLQRVFFLIEGDKGQLKGMSEKAFEIADRLLDYSKMAKRVLQ
ncbi:hypothetical protein D3C72_1966260 [compost metagenome]